MVAMGVSASTVICSSVMFNICKGTYSETCANPLATITVLTGLLIFEIGSISATSPLNICFVSELVGIQPLHCEDAGIVMALPVHIVTSTSSGLMWACLFWMVSCDCDRGLVLMLFVVAVVDGMLTVFSVVFLGVGVQQLVLFYHQLYHDIL